MNTLARGIILASSKNPVCGVSASITIKVGCFSVSSRIYVLLLVDPVCPRYGLKPAPLPKSMESLFPVRCNVGVKNDASLYLLLNFAGLGV